MGKALTTERLSQLFSYHEDGYLVYLVERKGSSGKIGKRLGRGDVKSYRQAVIDGVHYREHQLIWMLHHGRLPKLIDHIDHDIFNNKIENLREITHKENIRHGSGRQAGVTKHHDGRWVAAIYVDCVKKHLGIFNSYEDALAARKEAEEKYW